MARGRKPKDLNSIFNINSPNYIPGVRKNTPEEQARMDKWVKDSNNYWRELRRQGYTERYFEYEAKTDPELMGRPIPEEELAMLYEEYKDCLNNFNVAKTINSQAQKSGALTTKNNAQERLKLIKHYFPDVMDRIKNKEITASHAASIINQRASKNKNWKFDWVPKTDTLRKLLSKLAKATPKKNK